jgi:hypothetical protein
MLRRLALLPLLACVSVAHAETPGTVSHATHAELSEFDIRGLRTGMPFTAVPKALRCLRIGATPVVECLPEAGATLRVELTSAAAGERIASITYFFYSREPLGRDTEVGATLVAKYGEPTETLDGWMWKRGSASVRVTVPGDMQQALLRLEDPEFQKKIEQAAERPADAKGTKPLKPTTALKR